MASIVFPSQAPDPDTKEIFRGALAGFVVKCLGTICGYVFTLAVSTMYGAEALGDYAFAFSVLFIVSLPAMLGFDTSLVKFVARRIATGQGPTIRAIYTLCLQTVLPASIIAAPALWLLGPQLTNQRITNTSALWLALAIIPYVIYRIHSAGLQGLKRISQASALQNFAHPFSALLTLWTISMLGWQTQPAIAAGCSAIVICFLLSSWWWRGALSSIPHECGASVDAGAVIRESTSLMLAGSLLFMASWTDVFMLGLMTSARETGIYNVAFKLAMLVNFTLVSVNAIATPKFAAAHAQSDALALKVYTCQATRLIAATALPVCVVLIVLRVPLLHFFGPEFTEAGSVLIALCLGQMINVVCGSVGAILQMTGHHVLFQNILCISTIMNIALNLILIPIWGALGAAIASATSCAFWNLAATWHVQRLHGFSPLQFLLPTILRT